MKPRAPRPTFGVFVGARGSGVRRAGALAASAASLFALAAACHDEAPAASPPRRACGLTVWYRPSSAASRVEVVSSWDGWARPGTLMPAGRDDGWRVARFDVPAGEHRYALVDDGTWLVDPNVPTTAFDDGREVTWVDVPRCDTPQVRVDAVRATADGHVEVAATFLASSAGEPLDPAQVKLTGRDGREVPLDPARFSPATGSVAIDLDGLPRGKHAFALTARDTAGRPADPANVTAWVEARPFDLRDAVIYHVMLDRFRGDGGPLAPPARPSERAGGTLRGLTRAIEAGEVEALGANMIWASPLYRNPDGLFPGNDGRTYSSYHGYWPIDSRGIDPRLASEDDVAAFVSAAHRRGIRVLFDVVPNHVHDQHPYWRERREAGWFNVRSPTCVCGVAGCDWATHIQDCWFAPYMPDLDWKNPAVARQGESDVLFWIDRFDGDGIRIDAVPMMPRAATRRIVSAIRSRYEHPGNPMMLLGENFTGPGGFRLLKYQLGPFGLDSQFHFPLMWSLRGAIASEASPMNEIAETVAVGEEAFFGSGAVMATMLDNHDVSRFASVSAGTADGDTWDPAPESADPLVHAKQRLGLGLLFTLPGAPVVYYGDEIALAGRGDPDARRVMPSDAALSRAALETRAFTRTLGRARACIDALRRGTYRLLFADRERYAFAREGDGIETTVVVAFRNADSLVSAPFQGVAPGDYVDALTGDPATLSSELTNVVSAPFSLRIFVPRTSVCAPPAL